ncbi:aspartate kinase [Algoriphagus ratkowskyi]|uniref:Aspartokinase n=1 Tax=Algoriphagus ratkowskyi TaxID=57028 RepID=A0A2W7RJ05_9BACT|nr:aspartate kinase [Algoriphagus ratkowskyi]PZX60231.1 aspartate kinase [Algoriphagus ratkowskyi]TXD78056.1 aspartate kinase [Algoriphagus ratkowskyi]
MTKTQIYKFGGASVKDALAIQNLAEILRNRLRNNFVIVVSAMGKTTNQLETLLSLKLNGQEYSENSAILKEFHLEICRALFPDEHVIFPKIENYFILLHHELNKPISKHNYDEYYDRIIGFGELLSSRIVMEFLCSQGMLILWQDARELISTDSDFRFAKIDWVRTRRNCQSQLKPKLEQFPVLTQGFIGADSTGRPTTLGREGSDFTAAILAASLDAGSVTIWKDVPGVLNADPKIFKDTTLFQELDYEQAAQMTFYGASVIHPKTIKPLANAGIPLFVKSFLNPNESGTKIHSLAKTESIPTFILKKDQILVSLKVTDFTFIEEKHIHLVYEQLQGLKLRVNMLQTSAITISIVIDSQLFKLEQLLEHLKGDFEVRYNEGLELLTVLHPDHDTIPALLDGFEVLIEQNTRNTIQIVRRVK